MPAGTAASWDTLTDVIFTGYGINAPGKGWNDYADIDVRDKLVMVLGGTPDLEDVSFAGFAGTRDKFCMAEEAGAAGVLAIGHSVGTISSKQTLPAFRISSETANALLKGTGYSVDSLKHAMKAENHPITLHLKHRLRVQVTSTFQPDQATMNIVGVLPGSDPALQDQHLVLGAHADHLGRIAGHSFYGANDNGSGTATVLAVAKAFSELDTAPRRSIIFILFSGEEMGLLGSKYYTRHPTVPIDKIKAMVNLDMVGSGREALMIVGGHSYPDFASLFDDLSARYVHVPIRRRWISNNSDHYPFYQAGIPAVFLYAVGGVPTYHSTRDRAETLDPKVMETAGRITFLALRQLANADAIAFHRVERSE